MRSISDDIRYALRTLRKTPGFTSVAILTLALAIGATSSVFTVVNAVLLRELPFQDADRLVVLWGTQDRGGERIQRSQVCFPDVEDWKRLNHSFEDMAAFGAWQEVITGQGEAERISVLRVSPSFFHVMGAAPVLGRTFAPNENLDPAKASVAVLSYGLWQRKFARDPNILGKTFSLNSALFTIVGVMPPDFHSLPTSLVDTPVELYQPLSRVYLDQIRTGHHLRAIGRLKPGVALASAQAELSLISRQLEQQYPDTNAGLGVRLVKLEDDVVRNLRTGLLVLQAAVCLVVLIACANLANLLLARSTVRRREIAIRAAVGASRGRLVRQMVTESLVLAALGGAAGLLLAVWGVQALDVVGAKVIPELSEVSIDGRVLAFTAALSLLTGIVFGLAPAAQISIGNLAEAMRAGGRGTTDASGKTFRDLLVAAETALALVLLVGAGLLLNSFRNLRAVDPGFRTDNILTASVSMPEAKYTRDELRARFVRDLMAELRRSPGIREASAVSVLPESTNFNTMAMDIEGRVFARAATPNPDQYDVTPDYFRELGIPLIAGRLFTEQDDRNHPTVAIINQTAARRLWPGQNPIGARVHTGAKSEPWRTIVGVVGDVYQWGLDSKKTNQLYYPYAQDTNFDLTLVVRGDGNPTGLTGAVRRAVSAVDKDLPISDVEPLDKVVADSIAGRRFSMLLLALFAGGALALAALGIYGVISYSVNQRRNEFGVRIALGAQSRDVLSLVLRQSMRPVAAGTAIGLAAAFAMTRLLASLLFGVSATDLPTFGAVSLLLLGIALLASFVPAHRASNVDPLVALRYE